MAIINTVFPERVSMANRQAVQISFTSNLPVSENVQNVLRIFTNESPQEGQLLSFSYGDFTITFVFTPQGDGTSYTLSTRG
ncbi:MAG: hypothetical protein AAFU67_10685, partial [Bacteroidota bacterium]